MYEPLLEGTHRDTASGFACLARVPRGSCCFTFCFVVVESAADLAFEVGCFFEEDEMDLSDFCLLTWALDF